MSGGDPPIVIVGSSVTIEFDPSLLTPNGTGKFHNSNKKIKRVEVTGDGVDFAQNINNGQVTIRIIFGNP